MADQARVVFTKLEKLKPGAAQLASVWQEIEAAEASGEKSRGSGRGFGRRDGRSCGRAGGEAPIPPGQHTQRPGICCQSNPGGGARIQTAGSSDCARARAGRGGIRPSCSGSGDRWCVGRVRLRPGSFFGRQLLATGPLHLRLRHHKYKLELHMSRSRRALDMPLRLPRPP